MKRLKARALRVHEPVDVEVAQVGGSGLERGDSARAQPAGGQEAGELGEVGQAVRRAGEAFVGGQAVAWRQMPVEALRAEQEAGHLRERSAAERAVRGAPVDGIGEYLGGEVATVNQVGAAGAYREQAACARARPAYGGVGEAVEVPPWRCERPGAGIRQPAKRQLEPIGPAPPQPAQVVR